MNDIGTPGGTHDESSAAGADGGVEEPGYRETLTWDQVRRPLAVSIAATVALVLAALVGMWTASPRHPSTTSVDAGFARDMTAHHSQAVDMSMTMLGKAPSQEVRTLAYDVARTQENQRGQMMAWLSGWGLPLATSGPRMQWMAKTGHHHEGLAPGQMLLSDGRMPGMASAAQLRELNAAQGKEAEILYLRLMIVHHRAGVEMAKAAVAAAKDTNVVRLAQTMVTGQQSEIDLMTGLLKSRGAQPWSNAEAGQR